MSTLTTNLSLTKPDLTENADIAVINVNMDLIDTAVAAKETPAGAQTKADAAQSSAQTHADQADTAHVAASDPHSQYALDTDLSNLAGAGRTTETVKGVADAQAAHLADYVKQVPYAVDSGTANTYAVALNPAPTVYVDGMAVAVKITNASIGASTLNINALGVKPILDSLGNAITSGGLKAGLIYSFRYNATTGNFIVQGKGGGGNAVAGDLLSGKTATVDTGQITGILALTGSAVAGDILASKTAYNTDPKTQITGTIPSVVSQFLARAGTTDKALSNAYYQGCSIPSEPDALAVNILTGKTILGVAGTAIDGANMKRWASGSGTLTSNGGFTLAGLAFTPKTVNAYVTGTSTSYPNLFISYDSHPPLTNSSRVGYYGAWVSSLMGSSGLQINSDGFLLLTLGTQYNGLSITYFVCE